MAKIIRCECGTSLRGASEDDVVAQAEQHINDNHPELVGKVGRADLVAMSEDV